MPRASTAPSRRVVLRRAPRAVAPAYAGGYRTSGYGGYRKPIAAPVRRYAVRGRGGYWDNVKSRWKEGGGSMIGPFREAGRALAGPVGGALGGLANRALYALTGFGDYQVKNNVLLETNGPPSVVNRSNKEFVVRHREYITDIYSTAGPANTPSAFGNLTFSINPGDAVTFPWLSTIADKFEQYRVEGMVFEYKSLYSDAVVTQNGSIGSVVLATEYNAGAPAFTSKQAMENYQFAQSCKPSLSVLHPVECARSQNVLSELYVRPGAVPAGEDVKTYDFGDFQIASQGIPLGAAGAAVNMGELWVSYQIALIKPRIPTSASTYIDSGFAHFTSGQTGLVGAFTTANPAPMSVLTKTSSSNLPVNMTANNTFTISLGSVPMKYQLDFYWCAANRDAGNVWSAPGLVLTNATLVDVLGRDNIRVANDSLATATPGVGSAIHMIISVPAATPSAPTATVFVNNTGGFSITTDVFCDLFFNAVPTAVN